MKKAVCHAMGAINMLCAVLAVYHREDYALAAFALAMSFVCAFLATKEEP